MTITLRLDRYFLQHLKLLVSWSCQLLLSQHWDCVVLFWVLSQALSSLFDLLKLWCWPPRDVIFGSYILFVCFNISDQLYFSLLALFIRCKLPLRCNFLFFFLGWMYFSSFQLSELYKILLYIFHFIKNLYTWQITN